MDKEHEVLDTMRGIMDPDLGKDIVSLGFVKNLVIADNGDVSFTLELTTPACPVKEHFRTQCREAVQALPWVREVEVELSAQQRRSAFAQAGSGLSQVRHVVAVSSCKGGVGKSTVATNLAFALAGSGAKVGIFDADVYGPSLPVMVATTFHGLMQNEQQQIVPVSAHGLKLMSYAYASPPDAGPAIMRGPMVTQVINTLLTTTAWGELDYLVIDMPPGTGDIQLTLTQIIPMTASVIVTTPQDISFVDVVKGIQMFDKMKVPTIAVVENMSYFVCDSCDKRHDLFGGGAMKRLVEQFGFEHAFSLPLDPSISQASDTGLPLVAAAPESAGAAAYRQISEAVVREIARVAHGESSQPEVTFDACRGIVVAEADGATQVLAPAALRRRCRCAVCINEMTGEKVLVDSDVPDDIVADSISPMGNYAVLIMWSDEHSSIFPYDALRSAAAARTGG
jgi:Mrp family chromosome partitioning ATPase/DUF971 family protein